MYFLKEAINSKDATPALVKLRAQERALNDGYASAGNGLQMSRGRGYSVLRALRLKSEPQANESSSLYAMVADPGNDYVRDINVVGEAFVVLLANTEMLERGAVSAVFAGDATYKCATAESRDLTHKNWYLFNIMARNSNTSAAPHGIVVSRFRTTRLTTDAYSAG